MKDRVERDKKKDIFSITGKQALHWWVLVAGFGFEFAFYL